MKTCWNEVLFLYMLVLCSVCMHVSGVTLFFTVNDFLNDKCLLFQARSVEEKRLWAHHIKRLILENHNTIVPQKVNNIVPQADVLSP